LFIAYIFSFIFFESFFRYFKLVICRSHTSILSWFRPLSILFPDRNTRKDVRVLLVDDFRIGIGSREKVLYIALSYI